MKKSKIIIAVVIIGLAASVLSSCKANKCNCPTFTQTRQAGPHS